MYIDPLHPTPTSRRGQRRVARLNVLMTHILKKLTVKNICDMKYFFSFKNVFSLKYIKFHCPKKALILANKLFCKFYYCQAGLFIKTD